MYLRRSNVYPPVVRAYARARTAFRNILFRAPFPRRGSGEEHRRHAPRHAQQPVGLQHERAMLLGIRCADHDRLRGSQHYMHHARLRTSNSCCCALLCHTRNDQPRTPSLALRAPRCGWRCDCAIVPHRTCANAASARWQLFELQPPYGQPSAEHRASRQRECAASRLASRGRPRHVLSRGESTERAERVRRVGAAPTRHEAR